MHRLSKTDADTERYLPRPTINPASRDLGFIRGPFSATLIPAELRSQTPLKLGFSSGFRSVRYFTDQRPLIHLLRSINPICGLFSGNMAPLILNHPLYEQTIKNLERTTVRDKLLRLVQYFSRFLSYYCYRKGYSVAVVEQLKALTTHLSLARKAFRVGKPLNAFKALVFEFGNQTAPSVLHIASILRNLGSGTFLTLDTLIFLNVTGAYKFKPGTAKLISDTANKFWLLSILANIGEAAYRYHVETHRIRVLQADEKASTVEIRKAGAQRYQSARMLVSNLLDSIIPMTALSIIDADEGLVGLAGTITAYLGLKDLW